MACLKLSTLGFAYRRSIWIEDSPVIWQDWVCAIPALTQRERNDPRRSWNVNPGGNPIFARNFLNPTVVFVATPVVGYFIARSEHT